MADQTQTAVGTDPSPPRPSLLERTLVLKGAMPELWVTFAAKFLGIAAYSMMATTITLWLSADLGYSDQKAGVWYTVWSTLMTLVTLLVGSLTDAIGLRKAFLLGVSICVGARAIMTFTTLPWLALWGGLIPLAIGEALGTPVLVAATRRYSTTSQRSFAFSFIYVIMNVAFTIANFTFDLARKVFGEHGRIHIPVLNMNLSTYQTVFLISLGVELILVPILYFGIREGAEATDEGPRITPSVPKYGNAGFFTSLRLTIRDAASETVHLFGTLVRQSGFYQLLAFLLLISFVKLIFVQMNVAYPKFGIRELGEGAPIMRVWALNSILIIFLVPAVGVLTRKMSAYRAVTVGTIISAASVFIMAMPTSWFAPMAGSSFTGWMAHWYLGLTGSINPWYVMIAIYTIFVSVGEAFYSPRVYEYASAIAPPGQEASYGALSYLPFLVAKLLLGSLSGMLLARYCPEVGPRHSGTMWLVVALLATIAPIGLLVFRSFIRVREEGRSD